jgi:hypothetical protein
MNDKPRLYLPEDAPKDGSVILGDFGWGTLLPCAWCEIEKTWMVARLRHERLPEGTVRYFENHEEFSTFLRGWVDIPKDWLYTSRFPTHNR